MSVLQRPAHLANRAPSILAERVSGGLGVAQPPRISLKDDRFTLLMPNGDHHPQVPPALSINVIFVGGNPHASRIYYDANYDAQDVAAPICWSDNGVGPSVSAGTPQAATCAECPQAVWGSKISPQGSKIPACSTVKKLAVLVAGAGEMVFLLQIPPGSLKPWRGFLAHLDALGANLEEIVVRLTMTDKTLSFEAVDFMDPPTFEFAMRVIDGPEPDAVVGVKDKPREGVKDKPREGFLPSPQQPQALGFGTPSSSAPVSSAPAASFSSAPPPAQATFSTAGETPDQREAREFAEFKAAKAAGAAAQTVPLAAGQPAAAGFGAAPLQGVVEPPAPRTRAPRGSKKETVVGPGTIPAGTFAQPQGGGFIGGTPTPQQTPAGFGMTPPQPAAAAVNDAIARAFNLPTT